MKATAFLGILFYGLGPEYLFFVYNLFALLVYLFGLNAFMDVCGSGMTCSIFKPEANDCKY